MRILSSLTLASTFILAISGCGSAEHIPPSAAPNSTQSLNSYAKLSANIFSAKCVSCHSGPDPAGKVDLSSYAAIMSHSGLITPGQPAASLIYSEVQSGDMPDSAPPLSAAEVQAIDSWIMAGAPDGDFALVNPAPANPPFATPPSPTFAQVQTNIFNAACVSCHSGSKPKGQVNLSSYALIMAKSGLIVPGDAAKSLIYTEIINGKMPPKGTPVSASDQTLLHDWITAGALNN
jgi:hypothetical protein